VLGRAMIRDLYTQDKAASMIGYVTMGMMITPMVTPLLGGYLTEIISWKALFWVIVLLTLLAVIFAYLDLPETRNFKHADRGFAGLISDAKELVQVKRFWGYCLLGGFSSLTFFMFTGAAPYLMMQQMHLTPKDYGAWIAPIAAGYALGNWVSGKYTVQVGIDTMIKWGSITGVAACLLNFVFYSMGLLSQPIWLIVPQALLALANGLQLPSSMAGSAAGVNGCTQMMMGAVAAQATGWLVVQTQSVVPLISGLLISMVLGAICYRVLTRG
jgi:MFS transporter, DHA1 family, multidrug resistance protein